jgi:hypothetical protein
MFRSLVYALENSIFAREQVKRSARGFSFFKNDEVGWGFTKESVDPTVYKHSQSKKERQI